MKIIEWMEDWTNRQLEKMGTIAALLNVLIPFCFIVFLYCLGVTILVGSVYFGVKYCYSPSSSTIPMAEKPEQTK